MAKFDDSDLKSLYLTEEKQRELQELSEDPWKCFIENIKADWFFFTQTGFASRIKMHFNQFLYLIGIKKEWVTKEDYPEIDWDITAKRKNEDSDNGTPRSR